MIRNQDKRSNFAEARLDGSCEHLIAMRKMPAMRKIKCHDSFMRF
jgi:hypothetical protein